MNCFVITAHTQSTLTGFSKDKEPRVLFGIWPDQFLHHHVILLCVHQRVCCVKLPLLCLTFFLFLLVSLYFDSSQVVGEDRHLHVHDMYQGDPQQSSCLCDAPIPFLLPFVVSPHLLHAVCFNADPSMNTVDFFCEASSLLLADKEYFSLHHIPLTLI